jgi:hypothetical protein
VLLCLRQGMTDFVTLLLITSLVLLCAESFSHSVQGCQRDLRPRVYHRLAVLQGEPSAAFKSSERVFAFSCVALRKRSCSWCVLRLRLQSGSRHAIVLRCCIDHMQYFAGSSVLLFLWTRLDLSYLHWRQNRIVSEVFESLRRTLLVLRQKTLRSG